MDSVHLVEKINRKLAGSHFLTLVQPVIEVLSLYPTAHITVAGNPKKADAKERKMMKVLDGVVSGKIIDDQLAQLVLRSEFAAMPSVYGCQTRVSLPVREYENSVILVENELAIDFMIKEVAQFWVAYRQAIEAQKPLKMYPEIVEFYRGAQLKEDAVKTALLADHAQYCGRYSVDQDKKACMDSYKQYKTLYEATALQAKDDDIIKTADVIIKAVTIEIPC
jgi:hypothetical protein